MYVVYLRTNLVNGKQYVGQTKDFVNRERKWNNLKNKKVELTVQPFLLFYLLLNLYHQRFYLVLKLLLYYQLLHH